MTKSRGYIPFIIAVLLVLGMFAWSKWQPKEEVVEKKPPAAGTVETVGPLPIEGYDGDIDMQAVSSTCFSEVGYDEDSETLYVRFLDSGALYSYYPFAIGDYEDFMDAPSLGLYYNSNIKYCYECSRLE